MFRVKSKSLNEYHSDQQMYSHSLSEAPLRRSAVAVLALARVPKNREAGFGPASNRLAETFSLVKSLSSPQQLFAC
jgi:hypothetical protein